MDGQDNDADDEIKIGNNKAEMKNSIFYFHDTAINTH
jgi:hypothetical protein